MAEILEPRLKDRSGAGVQATLVSGSFRALPIQPYIQTFDATLDGPNVLMVWTTADVAPTGLTGFYAYTSADGGAWVKTGTFDADERSSSTGAPAFNNTLELYLLAHDSTGFQLSFPSVPVLLVRGEQLVEGEEIPTLSYFPDLRVPMAPGGEII